MASHFQLFTCCSKVIDFTSSSTLVIVALMDFSASYIPYWQWFSVESVAVVSADSMCGLCTYLWYMHALVIDASLAKQ